MVDSVKAAAGLSESVLNFLEQATYEVVSRGLLVALLSGGLSDFGCTFTRYSFTKGALSRLELPLLAGNYPPEPQLVWNFNGFCRTLAGMLTFMIETEP